MLGGRATEIVAVVTNAKTSDANSVSPRLIVVMHMSSVRNHYNRGRHPMKSKLHTLPVIEHWDCHQCTACCRETTIQLNADDLKRLKEQRWDHHPEFQGVQTVRRSLMLDGARVLAHKEDR